MSNYINDGELCPECRGEGGRVIPCPDGKPGCAVLHRIACTRCNGAGRLPTPPAAETVAEEPPVVTRLRKLLAGSFSHCTHTYQELRTIVDWLDRSRPKAEEKSIITDRLRELAAAADAWRTEVDQLADEGRQLRSWERRLRSAVLACENDFAQKASPQSEIDRLKAAHEAEIEETLRDFEKCRNENGFIRHKLKTENLEVARLRAELDKMTADHDDMWRNAMQSSARLGNAQERIDELEALLHSEREQRKNENLEMFEGLKAELDKAKGQLEAAEQHVKVLSESRDEAAAEVERLAKVITEAAEWASRMAYRRGSFSASIEQPLIPFLHMLEEQLLSFDALQGKLTNGELVNADKYVADAKPAASQPATNDAAQEKRLERISDCITDGHWQNAMRHTVAYLKAERMARNG